MSEFEKGHAAGLRDTPRPGLSHPCPHIPGSNNFQAWMTGYYLGQSAR